MKREAAYWNLSRVAQYFGLDASTLSKLGRMHQLYRPAVATIPTGAAAGRIGARTTRYHVEQIKIIERVLLGVTDLETGWLEWKVKRNRIAAGTNTARAS